MLVGISVSLGFFVLHVIPGNPLGLTVDGATRSADAVAELRTRYELDRPLPQQYAGFVAHALKGDLGVSMTNGQSVAGAVRTALGNSLALGSAALVLATFIGVAVGSLQGWQPASRVGRALGLLLTALYAAPEFILAIACMTVLAYRWSLFPIGGIGDPLIGVTGTRTAQLRDFMWHLALPALTLALGWSAAVARQQRVALAEIAGEHHVRSARAKGVNARAVFARHALRPSLPGVVVVVGLMLPELVGGAVIVETLFAWPGLGSLMLGAVGARDYPTVSAAIVVAGALVALAGLCTDALVAALDPRVRELVA